jgi:dGTPase
LKRCSTAHAAQLEALEPGGVGRRFLDGTQASLEAQLCNLADEIAYNAHDIDDGVRSGLISLESISEVPLFGRSAAQVVKDFPDLDKSAPRRHLAETLRRMLSAQVYDAIDHSRLKVSRYSPADAAAARVCPPLVAFSPAMKRDSAQLKRFLFRELYRHPRVVAMTDIGKQIVTELFQAYLAEPQRLPAEFLERADLPRAAADYIAGMTDRYARKEHESLSGRDLFKST